MTHLTHGNPPGVVIPLEWLDMFTKISREDAGEILLAILTYGATGALPEFRNPALEVVWPIFQSRLDCDRERYRQKVARSQAAAQRREQERHEKAEPRPTANSRYTPTRSLSEEGQAAKLDKWL